MSAAVANLVGAHLEGRRLASRFSESLARGISHPGAMSQVIADLDGKPDVRSRFAREVQKQLERVAG